MVCSDSRWISSKGIFVGDDPLLFSLPLLLLELSFIFFATNTTYCLLKRLGQGRFVSQIFTGILLGPSVMGRSRAFRWTLFPQRGVYILEIMAGVGLVFFLFIVGVKTDIDLLRRPNRQAIAISIGGSLVPFVLSMGSYIAFRPSFPKDLQQGPFILIVIFRLSLSCFAGIVDALDELQLLNSELGRVTVSAALLEEAFNLMLTGSMGIYQAIKSVTKPTFAVGIVMTFVGFPTLVGFAGRWMAQWMVRRTPAGDMLAEWHLQGLLLVALVASFMTGSVGTNVTLGPLVLGLALPGGVPVGVTVMQRLQPLCFGMLMPLYLVLIGYRTDFETMSDVKIWRGLEILVITCYIGKFAGAAVTSRCLAMPIKDAVLVGLILNIKGTVEIFLFVFFVDSEMGSSDYLPVLTLSMMAITAVTTPLIKLLYNPTMRYVVLDRCTIEHTPPQSELRLMACVHNEDHVTPLLNLFESSLANLDTPTSLTILHLNELVGRSTPLLLPYNRHRHGSTFPVASDRIMNAFHYFELHQSEPGSIFLHPFVAIAPYSSMHIDICSLALRNQVSLILLPFHKYFDGAQQIANHNIQFLNRKVLTCAPCSVAIFIDHALPARAATSTYTDRLLHHIVVYFLGGPDNREALAIASLMARKRSITVTIVRFLSLNENEVANINNEETKLDDAAIKRVQEQHAGNERLIYVEEVVKDGEDTATVIHNMNEEFDLMMVGRRNETKMELTSGLSEWSECLELGVIGDMLAMEFSERVAILVVQQHQRSGGVGREENNGVDSRRPGDGNIVNTMEVSLLEVICREVISEHLRGDGLDWI